MASEATGAAAPAHAAPAHAADGNDVDVPPFAKKTPSVRFDLSARCVKCKQRTDAHGGESDACLRSRGSSCSSIIASGGVDSAITSALNSDTNANIGVVAPISPDALPMSLLQQQQQQLSRGGMDESFIVLHPRKEGRTRPSRNRGQSGAVNVAAANKRRYHNTMYKLELLAIALGCSSNASRNPLDPNGAKALMLRPQIAANPEDSGLVGGNIGESDGAVHTSLCGDCLNYVQGFLRHEFLEQCQLQYHIREVDKSSAKFSKNATASAEKNDNIETEIKRLMEQQSELMGEADRTNRAREDIRAELARAEADEQQLAAQERAYWHDFALTQAAMNAVGEKRDSLVQRVKRNKRALKQLAPIHAFNDAFFIWRDRDYGTINGFRLGQLLGVSQIFRNTSLSNDTNRKNASLLSSDSSSSSVDAKMLLPTWEEVNTAWGLSAMLLTAIAQSCSFEFAGFHIVLMGSRTTILRLSSAKSALDYLTLNKQPSSYPLYYDYDKSNTVVRRLSGLAFANNSAVENFNRAMRAFLVCLCQLSDVAVQSSTGQALKLKDKMYIIDIPEEQTWHKGLPKNSCTINGDSVDLAHSPDLVPRNSAEQQQYHVAAQMQPAGSSRRSKLPSEEEVENAYRWTVSLRHMLTNLKWLLVWSVKEKRR